MIIQNFNRVEKKYIIDYDVYLRFMEDLKKHMHIDEYANSDICNIYFDTREYSIINRSLEKPVYKEKLRLRSYGVPTLDDDVFFEIKKKFKGIVYKRRISLKLKEFYSYFVEGVKPELVSKIDNQIFNEIDYFLKSHKIENMTYLSYSRESYVYDDQPDFRVTFDTNVMSRTDNVGLENGIYGNCVLGEEKRIMEVKTLGAMPLWFVGLLSKYKIKPCSFSKYGEAYKMMKEREK